MREFTCSARDSFFGGKLKATVPLRLAVKQDEAPCWLPELVDRPATLFWHGVIPELGAKKDAYRFAVDFDLLHAGFTVRAEHLMP
ncbi:hypothetical protein F6X37_16415 [Paraburkholderia sp. 31.1]|uniref:hypothetical protein n=1 Tax=Paraburkholderia sp. 31.1 TaxID=2615205 RepID=UPI001656051A|nr:hypothetical protein [Paraburkholderia sp. 31.1]MBC8723111.1 hypothetical protein [Paraburkholderia sp. 31.1]